MRRVFLGLRQRDLADIAGISREQVIRLERGECQPTWATARRLGLALAVEPRELFPDERPR